MKGSAATGIMMFVISGCLLPKGTGLRCGSCRFSNNLADCSHATTCRAGELCSITEVQGRLLNHYSLGCHSTEQCQRATSGQSSPGKFLYFMAQAPHSSRCCKEDMCNLHPPALETTQSPYRLQQGVECEVCEGDTCGVDKASIKTCPDDFPYCMNTVHNDHTGNKYIVKQCASADECNARWWKESSQRDECIKYDPSSIYVKPLSCTYCCLTGNCNVGLVPAKETRFVGTE